MLLERKQNLLELVCRAGHLKTKEIHPLGIDERHVADGLNGSLLGTELLNPGKRPDMAVRVFAHSPVFRIILEDCGKIRHILLDILFHIENQSLLRILQKVCIVQACLEDEIREIFVVCKSERFLVAPLVCLDRSPFDMDVGLIFQTFEDGAVVRIRFGAGREGSDRGQSLCLLQRESIFARCGIAVSIRKKLDFRRRYIHGCKQACRKQKCHETFYRSCLHILFSFLLCESNSVSFFQDQPFTEPAIMPASKYFWKKGYITRSGRLEIIIVAYFSSSASCALCAVLCMSEIMPDSGWF